MQDDAETCLCCLWMCAACQCKSFLLTLDYPPSFSRSQPRFSIPIPLTPTAQLFSTPPPPFFFSPYSPSFSIIPPCFSPYARGMREAGVQRRGGGVQRREGSQCRSLLLRAATGRLCAAAAWRQRCCSVQRNRGSVQRRGGGVEVALLLRAAAWGLQVAAWTQCGGGVVVEAA